MSTLDDMPNPRLMERYIVQGVEFDPLFREVLVTFADVDQEAGSVIDRVQRRIDLVEQPEMRAFFWEMADQLCDIIDESFKVHRRERRERDGLDR